LGNSTINVKPSITTSADSKTDCDWNNGYERLDLIVINRYGMVRTREGYEQPKGVAVDTIPGKYTCLKMTANLRQFLALEITRCKLIEADLKISFTVDDDTYYNDDVDVVTILSQLSKYNFKSYTRNYLRIDQFCNEITKYDDQNPLFEAMVMATESYRFLLKGIADLNDELDSLDKMLKEHDRKQAEEEKFYTAQLNASFAVVKKIELQSLADLEFKEKITIDIERVQQELAEKVADAVKETTGFVPISTIYCYIIVLDVIYLVTSSPLTIRVRPLLFLMVLAEFSMQYFLNKWSFESESEIARFTVEYIGMSVIRGFWINLGVSILFCTGMAGYMAGVVSIVGAKVGWDDSTKSLPDDVKDCIQRDVVDAFVNYRQERQRKKKSKNGFPRSRHGIVPSADMIDDITTPNARQSSNPAPAVTPLVTALQCQINERSPAFMNSTTKQTTCYRQTYNLIEKHRQWIKTITTRPITIMSYPIVLVYLSHNNPDLFLSFLGVIGLPLIRPAFINPQWASTKIAKAIGAEHVTIFLYGDGFETTAREASDILREKGGDVHCHPLPNLFQSDNVTIPIETTPHPMNSTSGYKSAEVLLFNTGKSGRGIKPLRLKHKAILRESRVWEFDSETKIDANAILLFDIRGLSSLLAVILAGGVLVFQNDNDEKTLSKSILSK